MSNIVVQGLGTGSQITQGYPASAESDASPCGDKTAYPIGADVQARVISSQISADAGVLAAVNAIDWNLMAAVGRREFERAVGRVMLATSQTRTFDAPIPPRRILPTQADLVSVSAFTVNSTAQVVNTDYILGPPNADADCEPFQWVEFLSYQMGSLPRRCVSITGLWGYAATIPEDAWNAMVARGVIEAYPELTVSRTGGLQSWKEADVAESYGVNPFGATVDMLRLSYERAVRFYKRVTVGI